MTEFFWRGRLVEGVLFDMDGVIAETRQAHEDAWIAFAKKEGFDITPEIFQRQIFGRGNIDVMQEYFPEHAGNRDYLIQKGDDKEDEFIEMVKAGQIEALPGLFEFVKKLNARGLKMAVGSSAPRRNVDTILDVFGLLKYFPVNVAMQDVERSKPAPDVFMKCAEKLGINHLRIDAVVGNDDDHAASG